jgi:hypothetical protein
VEREKDRLPLGCGGDAGRRSGGALQREKDRLPLGCGGDADRRSGGAMEREAR